MDRSIIFNFLSVSAVWACSIVNVTYDWNGMAHFLGSLYIFSSKLTPFTLRHFSTGSVIRQTSSLYFWKWFRKVVFPLPMLPSIRTVKGCVSWAYLRPFLTLADAVAISPDRRWSVRYKKKINFNFVMKFLTKVVRLCGVKWKYCTFCVVAVHELTKILPLKWIKAGKLFKRRHYQCYWVVYFCKCLLTAVRMNYAHSVCINRLMNFNYLSFVLYFLRLASWSKH